ncbi:MAG: XdhC family protein [Rhodobacteraceae bacterium]|nr:XdhC family protein [Paracoccaceae bacterium]
MEGPVKDPLDALDKSADDAVLAVIIGVSGPSYRPIGAMMAIFQDGSRVSTLSSGCIESDLVLHAIQALKDGKPSRVVYGQGSPFMDIKLPCGGGLEILLLPRPDRKVLAELAGIRAERRAVTLNINLESGDLRVLAEGRTGYLGDGFNVRLLPEIMFHVFGKGPEASTFASLVQSAGYPNLLLSPDPETLEFAARAGCATRQLKQKAFPAELRPDRWSAVILFFHDHDWEPEILKDALTTDAFYIGAQGSQRARDARMAEIIALGVAPEELDRLKGPIGLIPSARDARTLAVSVLAEVLSVAMWD